MNLLKSGNKIMYKDENTFLRRGISINTIANREKEDKINYIQLNIMSIMI